MRIIELEATAMGEVRHGVEVFEQRNQAIAHSACDVATEYR